MLRREYGKAIKHIQAGITIFAEQNTHTTLSKKGGSLIHRNRLESLLRNLETHLCELSMEDRFPLMPRRSYIGRHALPHQTSTSWVNPDPAESLTLPPFVSISDAHQELDALWHNLMFVLHELGEPETFIPRLSPEQLMAQLVLFRGAFRSWRVRFDQLTFLLERRPNPLKPEERKSLAQLEMYRLTGEQILNPSLTDEMSWDTWTHGFEHTLDLCEIIIRNETQGPNIFQIDHGIVVACFHTIRKCRAARIRLRALDLLSQQRRQDGLWDAQLVAKAGRFIDEIERGGASLEEAAARDARAGEIPVWRRIRAIDVMFSSEGREAVLTFLMPRGEWDETIVRVRKTITW